MKLAIVEDSRLARIELKTLLRELPQHELIGEAANLSQAKELIESQQPDLVLLDIDLPDGNSFSLLENLEYLPKILFTTAHEEFALAAFAVNAVDYLLKPIEFSRLAQAILRAEDELLKSQQRSDHRKGAGETIFLRDGDNCYFVKLADITLWEVVGNYTRAYFDGKSPLLPRSLSYLEAKLDSANFIRVNRQQIVNLAHIERVEPWVTDGLLLKLTSGHEVEVSRRQAKELRRLMEI